MSILVSKKWEKLSLDENVFQNAAYHSLQLIAAVVVDFLSISLSGLFRQMMSHYAKNQTDQGDLLLAKFVLGGLRTATLVGNALFSCPAGACPKEMGGQSDQGINGHSGQDFIEQSNGKIAGEGKEHGSQESDQGSDQQNVHQGHQQELPSGKARKLFRPYKPRLLKNNVEKSI